MVNRGLSLKRVCNFTTQCLEQGFFSDQSLYKAIASGGASGAPAPPGPVEPDTSSLWMELFSLDSVIFIIVTCNCLPFPYSRSIFQRHVS